MSRQEPRFRPPLTLKARRVDGAPVVAVRVWLLGGSRIEEAPGQAAVTGRMLAEGSRRRGWRQIADEAENRGMAIWSFGGLELMGVAVDALAEDWRQALEWAAELALEPAFPEDRCDWIRRQARAELESALDQPEVRTAREFLSCLYGAHPKGRPVLGTAESLRVLGPADCRAQHRRAISGGILVAVTGEIDEDEVLSEAGSLFRNPPEGTSVSIGPPLPLGSVDRQHTVSLGEGGAAHLYLGHLTVPADHPQLPALELAAVILGAGPGLHGRLPLELREKRGLAYVTSVETAADAGLDTGYLSVYLGTAPENLATAERIVMSEIERMAADGPTDSEVKEAKSYLLGREPFRRETARQWADLLARSELYGLPLDRPEWVVDRIVELDRQRVHQAVRQFLRPADIRVVAGVPAAAT